MPTNYVAISERNQEEYGRAIRRIGDQLLSQLYSERTHFVYELLQNAEDAGAESVRFRLFPDRLEFSHNGSRLFTEEDVIGICGVIESTKTDDISKIGKFGIGFKAVYAYTDCPRIHSGDKHFEINDYVFPRAIEPARIRPNETLFIFPFNHNVPSEQAYSEIKEKLRVLGARTALFLQNIREISWEVDDGDNGVYLKEEQDLQWARKIVVIGESNDDETTEEWLVFEKQFTVEHFNSRIEVAYRLEVDGETHFRVVHAGSSNLCVFFPTEKETHLGFLVQGPYRTTSARDNIRQDDPFNLGLIDLTAELAVETLRLLREQRLLDFYVFEALPIHSRLFEEQNTLFKPVYDRILQALREDTLIPIGGGEYRHRQNCIMTNDKALRRLLSKDDLEVLLPELDAPDWIQLSISQSVQRFLIQDIGINLLTWDVFINRLNHEFLEQQEDVWLISLYGILRLPDYEKYSHPRNYYYSNHPSVILKPIVRLEDGSHVIPFDEHSNPNAYLPAQDFDDFPYVKASIANDEIGNAFLTLIGLSEPDIIAVVIEKVLPKYSADSHIRMDEHVEDIKKIVIAVEKLREPQYNSQNDHNLVQEIRRARLLRAKNIGTGEVGYRSANEIYQYSDDLAMYFEGNKKAWFLLDADLYRDLLPILKIETQVRVSARRSYSWYVTLVSQHGWHKRGLEGFDPDCDVDGLSHALRNSSTVRAHFIWNQLLVPIPHLIYGKVETSTRQTYEGSRIEEMPSRMGRLVRESEWLPDKNGVMHRPSEIRLDDLPDEFKKDERLAQALGMLRHPVDDIVERFGISEEDLTTFMRHRGVFEALANQLRQREKGGIDDTEFEEDHVDMDETLVGSQTEPDYGELLRDSFNRPGTQTNNSVPDYVQLREPLRKPSRGSFDINPYIQQPSSLIPIAGLPSSAFASNEKLKPYTRRVFGVEIRKNPNTRVFLEREYHGRCQICNHTFRKSSNGRPYFEAVYIVSHRYHKEFDNPGNVVCLCPNHAAEYLYGSLTVEVDLEQQILGYSDETEYHLHLILGGRNVRIRYTTDHINKLKELLEARQKL